MPFKDAYDEVQGAADALNKPTYDVLAALHQYHLKQSSAAIAAEQSKCGYHGADQARQLSRIPAADHENPERMSPAVIPEAYSLWGGPAHAFPRSIRSMEKCDGQTHDEPPMLDVAGAQAFIRPRVTHASLQWKPPSALVHHHRTHAERETKQQLHHHSSLSPTTTESSDRRVHPNFGKAKRGWPTPQRQPVDEVFPQYETTASRSVHAVRPTSAFVSGTPRFHRESDTGPPSAEYCGDPMRIKDPVLKRVCAPKWVAPVRESRGPVLDNPEGGDSGAETPSDAPQRRPPSGHTFAKAGTQRDSYEPHSATTSAPGPGAYDTCRTWAYLQPSAPSNAPAKNKPTDRQSSTHDETIARASSMQDRFQAVLLSAGLVWDDSEACTVACPRTRPQSASAPATATAEGLVAASIAQARADQIIEDCGASLPAQAVAPLPRAPRDKHEKHSPSQRPITRGKAAYIKNEHGQPQSTPNDVDSGVLLAARGRRLGAAQGRRHANLDFQRMAPRWGPDDQRSSKQWIPSSKLQPQAVPAQAPTVEGQAGEEPPQAVHTITYADGSNNAKQDISKYDSKLCDTDDERDQDAVAPAMLPRNAMWRKLMTAVETLVRCMFGCTLEALPDGVFESTPLLQAVIDGAAKRLASESSALADREHACQVCKLGAKPCRHSPIQHLIFEEDQFELRNTVVAQVFDQIVPQFFESLSNTQQGSKPSDDSTPHQKRRICERDLTIASRLSVPEWLHIFCRVCRQAAAFFTADTSKASGVYTATQAALRPVFPLQAAHQPDSTDSTAVNQQAVEALAEAHKSMRASRLESLQRAHAARQAEQKAELGAVERRRAQAALHALRAERSKQSLPSRGSQQAGTKPFALEYNLGRQRSTAPEAAFGSAQPRLAGSVPGTMAMQGGDGHDGRSRLVVRVRDAGQTGSSDWAPDSKCQDSDSDDSFVSWGSAQPAHADTDTTKAARKRWHQRQQASTSAGSLDVHERVIARHNQEDGKIVEIIMTSAKKRGSKAGPGYVAAGAGDGVVRPRQGRGVVPFAPTPAPSKAGATKEQPQAWQQVADLVKYGVRLPPTDVQNPRLDERLKRDIAGAEEDSFLAAAEELGQAIVDGRKCTTTTAWAAVELAEAHGGAVHKPGGSLHPAAAVHGKDTPLLRKLPVGGVVMKPESSQGQAAKARKQLSEARQADWYASQLHSGLGAEHTAAEPAETRAAFGRTLAPNLPAGPYSGMHLHATPADSTPGPGAYDGAASMRTFEAAGGARAPAFSFAAPGADSVPQYYAEGKHLDVTSGARHDSMMQALAAARAAGQPAIPLMSAADLDRPDRAKPPAFTFPSDDPARGSTLRKGATFKGVHRNRTEAFTGVEVDGRGFNDEPNPMLLPHEQEERVEICGTPLQGHSGMQGPRFAPSRMQHGAGALADYLAALY